jgi:phage minor structural protein
LTKTIVGENDINYNLFVPQYNDGAEKVRTITAKESNYFNIFQTIAETFECWVDIVITRDTVGGILNRTIKFKNYTGQENYACFRYGVNLQDIQRTFESKQLATKLIVKQNNNQLGDNGFCTIARAGSNPTGENYIYDFGYFHKTGLLDATQYQAQMYYNTNPLTGVVADEDNL